MKKFFLLFINFAALVTPCFGQDSLQTTSPISIISVQKVATETPAVEIENFEEKEVLRKTASMPKTAKTNPQVMENKPVSSTPAPPDDVASGIKEAKIAQGLGAGSLALFIGGLTILNSVALSTLIPWLVLGAILLGIAAVIVGVRSLRKLRQTPHRRKAIWGIVLGALGAALPIIFMAMIIAALKKFT